ncbi:putative ABC transport system permease protein [Reichenbachiella faecimaris]|uniref:Putative ABC transport system permease protein n=1 Tax=Reichenbachiella faecimaris TaxID=692418 RepID=A0A1W2GI50_REIFA|nr:ABC transporter permease [Reichenbachiella faecimaris]SMD36335.1 putative ABC transport system permease protein [Reichenbachiella faecimaris]
MDNSLQIISIPNLLVAFVPVVAVLFVLWKWQQGIHTSLWAVVRMVIQLVMVGYVLTYIFESDNAWIVIGVLAVMLFSSSWIALRTLSDRRSELLMKALVAIVVGGVLVLLLISQGVLMLDPWYMPQYLIPLAGMIFANAMNCVSLAGERLTAELDRGVDYTEARNTALQAALIPITNALFAVGLVSLPGMMTGQILSGVSPLIAVRYQIMVMCMAFGSAGISVALFLILVRANFVKAGE